MAKNLDYLKTERTNLRRLFTMICNQFDNLIKQTELDSTEVSVLYNKIRDKADRLFNVDVELSMLIESSAEEFDLTESYRDRFTEIRTVYEKFQNSGDKVILPVYATATDHLKLPKLNLKEYELSPRVWVAFWGQFSHIHEDSRLSEVEKFQYLLCSLKPNSKARNIADSYPPSKENYEKAIDHLKNRFGRDDLLIEVYVRDLLSLVNNKSNMKLTSLYDQLGSYLRTLESLGVTADKYAAMLYPVVESCLPTDVLKAWDRFRLNRESELDSSRYLTKEKLLTELMVFLNNEVEGEEHRALAEGGFKEHAKNKRTTMNFQHAEVPSASALVSSIKHTSTSGKSCCIFCERLHSSQDCAHAATMSIEDRKSVVIRKNCCLVCLKVGHRAKRCHSTVKCLICGRRHYVLLCPELPAKEKETSKDKEKTTILFAEQSSSNLIYLKTLMVRLRHKGRTQYVRALLDDGSHRSYIEESLARELKLTPSGKEVMSQGLFGGRWTTETTHRRYNIVVESLDSEFSCQFSVLDQPKICTTLPRVRDRELLSELSMHNIRLTDVGHEDPPIRMLIGADLLGKILTGRIEILKTGISAVETKFGWSILGSVKKRTAISMVALSLANYHVDKMWELDVLGITDPTERKTSAILEEETLLHFRETVKKDVEQRYEVALPWLSGHPPLDTNYDIAESRLHSVTKRLRNEGLLHSYEAIFHQWETEGIIERVPPSEILAKAHYLPHRPVVKPSSNTTKIRPVFDASAKRPGRTSLNDCLSVGPSLSQQIHPLLIKFRLGAIGVIADIKQAFLQISVRPQDRDVLRFLWWADVEHTKVRTYRHCRVVFGVSSSPFLLNATIIHHLNSEELQERDKLQTIRKLKEGFYIDNLVTSVDSKDELERLRVQAQEIMQAGLFKLRCWGYNGIQNEDDMMVLGLKWNVQKDEMYCVGLKMHLKEALTKRKLLSIVNGVYDPIGFTCPALLLPKLLLQEAWSAKVDWDEELPDEIQQRFRKWIGNAHLIEQCTIPRRMLRGKYEMATLHIFADASAYAYACCAFLRCEDECGVSVHFVAGKARVAPMQRPTIPRLELLAAAIGARLATTIEEALIHPLRKFYWTDSMIVLGWITNREPWNTFVGNRVKEIRNLTDMRSWRHVPGEKNPADLPSRSCDWKELLERQWWEGPAWLREPEETWPSTDIILPEEALLERKKTVLASTNVVLEEKVSRRFMHFSKYTKIVRMTAWLFRFCHNARNSPKISNALTGEEILKAETALLRLIQSEWPSETRNTYARSIRFYEDDGILRVKTKLVLGNDSEEFRRPAVLPDHPLVRRLIEHTHRSLLHSGVQTILSHLRERYWIPRGRRVVREVVRSCVSCKRHSSKPVIPETAPLPAERIGRVAAFEITGADLAGPVYLRGRQKAWIVLFTCAVYRAIHLELVTSLSTEGFMQAMRRFIARRGRCSTMYTDNGTNFLGTERAFRGLDWKEIEEESALLRIKWRFSPPTAPWYGGWWERMIRCIKQLLRKVLGKSCVTYEEMNTLLCDCESIINGRPLTYVYDDPNEPLPITPSHFIQDIREGNTTDFDIIDSRHLLKRVRYLQTLREHLRLRFQREYLGELIRNPQVPSKRSKISVGDIVLIGSDNSKRIRWPLARVVSIITGKDNVPRIAQLRTANGEIIRPFQRLYPLEISQEEIPGVSVIPELEASKIKTKGGSVSKETKKGSTKLNDFTTSSENCMKGVVKTRGGRLVRAPMKLNL